jgi:heat shock protein HtpX
MMLKRVVLFVVTNLLVMMTLGLIWSLFVNATSFGASLQSGGFDFGSLMVFCLFWGMGGAFISLLISRWIAKKSSRAQIINPATASGDERWLLDTVYRFAEGAGISVMPEVGIYPSAELNAFATGPTKNRAFVAVSEGLLATLNKGEIEGVLGHEMSHVANGDMVTLTLIQGVVNAFVMFLSWIVTRILVQAMRGGNDNRREGMGDYFLENMINMMLHTVLFFVAVILVIAPFSRWREFRADAGGAERAGTQKMIAALEALQRYHGNLQLQRAEAQANAQAPALGNFKISGDGASLMATHPSLEERIARLKQLH